MPKRQSGHIFHSIEAVTETDIQDFTNVTHVMIIWDITEYINSIIPEIKQNSVINII
jgi:hypothetical protein